MEQIFSEIRQAQEAVEEGRSQVARLRRDVRYWESRCTSATGSRYGVKVSGGGPVRGGAWDELCERKDALARQERAVAEQEQTLSQWIDSLPKPRWRMVLRARYLDGMPLGEVAEEQTKATGREFSTSQVYRLHREALKAAEELWPIP